MTLAPTRSAEPQKAQITEDLTSLERFAGRKRWTREDYLFLERLGMLSARSELIDGEIIEKVGQNFPHGICVMKAILWLAGIFGGDFVQTQVTVEVADADQVTNRPEPDVFVLTKPAHEYTRTPPASELSLIIEVSDTTLRDDLQIKAPLYARAGVLEYWVLDVTGRRLFMHRTPVDGVYTEVQPFLETESVALESAPGREVLVAELLPPVTVP
jgi:Uma2 family endonuclease